MAEAAAVKKKKASTKPSEGILVVSNDGEIGMLGGETRIAGSVIETIAGVAARDIEGVYQLGGGAISQAVGRVTGRSDTTLGVSAEVGKKEVAIDMVMIIEYDYSIYEVTQAVRNEVAGRIEHMTHLQVKEVNIDVVGIHYDTREPKQAKKGRVE